jgi:hypothetical protein
MTGTEGQMDREALEARRAQVLTDYHVIVGHLRELDYWLARLDQEAAPSPPPDEPLEVPED